MNRIIVWCIVMLSYFSEQHNSNRLDNFVDTYHLFQDGIAVFNVGNTAPTQQIFPHYYPQLFQTTANSVARQNSQHHNENQIQGISVSHDANGSTDLSFMITLSQDQAKVFLSRAKRMHKASKDCQQLTQNIVQAVNQTFANIKDKNGLCLFNDVQASNTSHITGSGSFFSILASSYCFQ